jgi:hypothetical protein
VIVRPRFGREVHWDGFLDPVDLIDRGRVAMSGQIDVLEAILAERS